MKHVLGIDMSLTNTGMVLLREDQSILSSMLISPKTKGYERAVRIVHTVLIYVGNCRVKDLVVSIEDFMPGRGRFAAMDIAKVQGAIVYNLHAKNIPVLFIHPRRVNVFEANHCPSDNDWSEHVEDAWSIAQLGMGVFLPCFISEWNSKLQELVGRMKSECKANPYLTLGKIK